MKFIQDEMSGVFYPMFEPGDKVKLRYNNKDSKHPKVDNSLYIYFDKNTGHEYTADGLLSTFSVFLARKN